MKEIKAEVAAKPSKSSMDRDQYMKFALVGIALLFLMIGLFWVFRSYNSDDGTDLEVMPPAVVEDQESEDDSGSVDEQLEDEIDEEVSEINFDTTEVVERSPWDDRDFTFTVVHPEAYTVEDVHDPNAYGMGVAISNGVVAIHNVVQYEGFPTGLNDEESVQQLNESLYRYAYQSPYDDSNDWRVLYGNSPATEVVEGHSLFAPSEFSHTFSPYLSSGSGDVYGYNSSCTISSIDLVEQCDEIALSITTTVDSKAVDRPEITSLKILDQNIVWNGQDEGEIEDARNGIYRTDHITGPSTVKISPVCGTSSCADGYADAGSLWIAFDLVSLEPDGSEKILGSYSVQGDKLDGAVLAFGAPKKRLPIGFKGDDGKGELVIRYKDSSKEREGVTSLGQLVPADASGPDESVGATFDLTSVLITTNDSALYTGQVHEGLEVAIADPITKEEIASGITNDLGYVVLSDGGNSLYRDNDRGGQSFLLHIKTLDWTVDGVVRSGYTVDFDDQDYYEINPMVSYDSSSAVLNVIKLRK